jgi:predicted dehydrogenase
LVNGGDIGAISSIESAFTFSAAMENNYRLNPAMGGGSLLDVGVYQGHFWRALVHGEPELSINTLRQNMARTGVDLTTEIVGTLGVSVEISALSSFEMPEAQKLVVTGELATIQCPGSDAFTSWHSPSSLRIGDHIEEFAPVDPYRLMIENFGAHISGESAWIPSIDQSLYVAKLLNQIKEFHE